MIALTPKDTRSLQISQLFGDAGHYHSWIVIAGDGAVVVKHHVSEDHCDTTFSFYNRGMPNMHDEILHLVYKKA